MKKFLTAVSLILVITTIWFQRYLFFEKYDAEYMHDYYSFSQWSIPLSSRIMGDADLFAYSGYNLTNQYKPFSINPETPIFAKLFFGYSAKYLSNHHLASVLFLFLLICGIDHLAKNNFKFSKNKRILLSLLIFTSAEIQLQLTSTTLDLPQVMLFSWHLVFLFNLSKKKSNTFLNILISGILLGFMSATKPALYVPFILVSDIWYLYKNNKLKQTATLLFSVLMGYLSIYLPVIFSDGVQSFISTQKWVMNFYLSSEVKAPIGMMFITSFSGFYRGWWNDNWSFLNNWNGSWALGLATYFYYIFNWGMHLTDLAKGEHLLKTRALKYIPQIFNKLKLKKTYSLELTNILISLGFILLILLKIPFWTRYLVFLIPFFLLLILKLIKNKKLLLLLLIFPLISTTKLIYYSYKTPTKSLELIQLANHEELYNLFSSNFKHSISRNEFVIQSLEEYSDIKANNIQANIIAENKNSEHIVQDIDIIYSGLFGEKIINKQIIWKRENSKWKIEGMSIHNIEVNLINRKIHAICLNPVEIEDWGNINNSIMDFYKITRAEISKKTMNLSPRDYCIPILEIKNIDQIFPNGIKIITNK